MDAIGLIDFDNVVSAIMDLGIIEDIDELNEISTISITPSTVIVERMVHDEDNSVRVNMNGKIMVRSIRYEIERGHDVEDETGE